MRPGEAQTVEFTLMPRDLALVQPDGRAVCAPGTIRCYIGGAQPDASPESERRSCPIRISGTAKVLPR